jgi:hypothetical protein
MTRIRTGGGCISAIVFLILLAPLANLIQDKADSAPPERSTADLQPEDHTGNTLWQATRYLTDDGFTVTARDLTTGQLLEHRSLRHVVCKQNTTGNKVTLLAVYTGDSTPGCPTGNEKPISIAHLAGTAADYAVSWLQQHGIPAERTRLRSTHADLDVPEATPRIGWTVCSTAPGDGEKLHPSTAHVELYLTTGSRPCPTPQTPPPVAESATPTPSPMLETDPDPVDPGTGNTGGAMFGRICRPVGATARTTDGRPAICRHGRDGINRWSYRHN